MVMKTRRRIVLAGVLAALVAATTSAALARGFFRDQLSVNESPEEVRGEAKAKVTLTEAPEAVDQVRMRFEKP
jgi:hypothetical protein